jgi:hypothetical protein
MQPTFFVRTKPLRYTSSVMKARFCFSSTVPAILKTIWYIFPLLRRRGHNGQGGKFVVLGLLHNIYTGKPTYYLVCNELGKGAVLLEASSHDRISCHQEAHIHK